MSPASEPVRFESAYLDQGPDAEARRYRVVRRLLETQDQDPGALIPAMDLAQNAIAVYRAAPAELAPQLDALVDHPDTAIRRRAADLLAVSADGARAGAKRLSHLLESSDPVLAEAAASGLARVGDERVVPRVISALGDPAGPPRWIGDGLASLPQHADLLLPMVSSAIRRLAAECASGQCRSRSVRAMLTGIADWGQHASLLIEEVGSHVPAECVISRLADDIPLRSESEPTHLATVFSCLTGHRHRDRMRRRLRKATGEQGIVQIEADVDHILATAPGRATRRGSLVIDLAVIAKSGTMRAEHEALLEQFLDSESSHTLHAAYALWLLHRTRARDRARAVLTASVADAYYGPTALGYLAEMGPDAVGALNTIDTLLARRRRLTVNDPDWRYELRTDENLCAAARAARRFISGTRDHGDGAAK